MALSARTKSKLKYILGDTQAYNDIVDAIDSPTYGEGEDIAFGTTTGTKLGTSASQKIGFWNTAPVVQPSGAAQAALTNSTSGTTDGTLELVGATNSGNVAGAINNNFSELHVLVNAIRTALVNTGIMKGSA